MPWIYPPEHDTLTVGNELTGSAGFVFNPALSQCHPAENQAIGRLGSSIWYRIKATKTGYEDLVTYRYHDYDETCRIPQCRAGAPAVESPCEHWKTFSLVPVGKPVLAKPDMIVDERDLKAAKIGCGWVTTPPSSGLAPDVVVLRVALGTANVGTGSLIVEQLRPGGACDGNGFGQCPSGTYCNNFFGDNVCVASSCQNDSHCPPELRCDVGSQFKLCKPKSCVKGSDCLETGTNECLPTGRCELYVPANLPSCRGGAPCPSGTTCNASQRCEYPSCSASSPCTNPELTCDQGVCKAKDLNQGWCHSDADCVGKCALETGKRCKPPTVQIVRGKNGGEDLRRKIGANLTYHPNHDHVHVSDYASMAIVSGISRCKMDPDRRASYSNPSNPSATWESDCIIAKGQKLSFCITDFFRFDQEIGDLSGNSSNQFEEGDQCNRHVQGMTPGWKDVYGTEIAGQSIFLGRPKLFSEFQRIVNTYAGRKLLIEAHVDPDELWMDRDRDNNWARATVTVPALSSTSPNWGNFCQSSQNCVGYQPDPNDPSPENDLCKEYLDLLSN